MKLLHADFEALRKKISLDEVAQKLYKEAISQADGINTADFPEGPIKEHCYVKKIDNLYTDEYLGVLQEYDDTSWLYERAFRKLSFAYKMTGEKKYLDKFLTALDRCLQNPFWGPKNSEYDHCSSRILRSLCVSLTWLRDVLPKDRTYGIRARMKKEVMGFYEKYRRMGDDYPIGPNDHQSKDLAGSGCAAWFLLEDEPEMKSYFDRFSFLFCEKLIGETISEDGGWPDGWACVLYALMDVIAFLEVMEEATGEDLTRSVRMQRTCDFFLGSVWQHKCGIPGEIVEQPRYAYIHTVFWMASKYGRKDLQFIAKSAVLQGLIDLDYSDYAFICYDETLKAEEYAAGGVTFTRSVGWGRLGWGTNTDSIYLWLKSGPADAFCRNNQNGLLLTAFGRQLFTEVTLQHVGYRKLWRCVYEEGLWTTKCATAILVNGQNQIRNRYGEDWGPIMRFHNPNRPKWGDEDAWWFDFEEPKAPIGRIVGARDEGDWAMLAGRSDRCFGDLLNGYTRTCIMTLDGLIVIVDTLIPGAKAMDFQFRANTGYEFVVRDRDRAAIIAREVRSDILFLYDGDYEISVGKWAFNPGPGNYLTGNFKLQGGKARLITVLHPYRGDTDHSLDAKLIGDNLEVFFDDKTRVFDLKHDIVKAEGGTNEQI